MSLLLLLLLLLLYYQTTSEYNIISYIDKINLKNNYKKMQSDIRVKMRVNKRLNNPTNLL